MSKVKGPTKTVHRDAGDGQFVTKKFADSHPKTTEKEKVHIPQMAPKKN